MLPRSPSENYGVPVLIRSGGVTAVDLGTALVKSSVDHRAEVGWSAIAGGVGFGTALTLWLLSNDPR